jgi:hypothetical protein
MVFKKFSFGDGGSLRAGSFPNQRPDGSGCIAIVLGHNLALGVLSLQCRLLSLWCVVGRCGSLLASKVLEYPTLYCSWGMCASSSNSELEASARYTAGTVR